MNTFWFLVHLEKISEDLREGIEGKEMIEGDCEEKGKEKVCFSLHVDV